MKINEVSPEVFCDDMIELLKEKDFFWAVDRLRQAKKDKEWVKLGFTIKDGAIKARSFEGTELFDETRSKKIANGIAQRDN